MNGWDLFALLIAWGLAGGSPGPATLTISSTAMTHGRRAGIVSGIGILSGSATWGLASALGMGALMLANAWAFGALKLAGALYLGFLAIKSFRSAFSGGALQDRKALGGSLFKVYVKSALIHLTNPKAILSWGAIYAVALPANAPAGAVFILFGQLLSVSALVFVGYGVLFSSPWVVAGYRRTRRVFETGFGLLFGAASLKILTT